MSRTERDSVHHLQTGGWDSVRWFREGGGVKRGVLIPVFPRLHFHLSHGTTLVTPPPLRAQTASWRQYWVSSPAEGLLQSISGMKKMIFLRRLFFQVRSLGEEGNYYTRGENRRPCPACRGGRGSGSDSGRGETRDLWKRLGMTQEKLPPSSSRPVRQRFL